MSRTHWTLETGPAVKVKSFYLRSCLNEGNDLASVQWRSGLIAEVGARSDWKSGETGGDAGPGPGGDPAVRGRGSAVRGAG